MQLYVYSEIKIYTIYVRNIWYVSWIRTCFIHYVLFYVSFGMSSSGQLLLLGDVHNHLERGTVLPSILFLFHEAVVSSICNDTIFRWYCSTVVMGIINHVTYVFLYSNYFFSVVGIYRYCHCHQIIFSRKNCLTVKFVFHVLLSNLV